MSDALWWIKCSSVQMFGLCHENVLVNMIPMTLLKIYGGWYQLNSLQRGVRLYLSLFSHNLIHKERILALSCTLKKPLLIKFAIHSKLNSFVTHFISISPYDCPKSTFFICECERTIRIAADIVLCCINIICLNSSINRYKKIYYSDASSIVIYSSTAFICSKCSPGQGETLNTLRCYNGQNE